MQAHKVFPSSEGVRINGFGASGDEFCAVAGCNINNVKATRAFSATNFCASVRFMGVAPSHKSWAARCPRSWCSPRRHCLVFGIYIKATLPRRDS